MLWLQKIKRIINPYKTRVNNYTHFLFNWRRLNNKLLPTICAAQTRVIVKIILKCIKKRKGITRIRNLKICHLHYFSMSLHYNIVPQWYDYLSTLIYIYIYILYLTTRSRTRCALRRCDDELVVLYRLMHVVCAYKKYEKIPSVGVRFIQ